MTFLTDTIKKGSLLFTHPQEFKYKAVNYFSSAASQIQDDQVILLLANALAKILQGVLGKTLLKTAYVGTKLLPFSESLQDYGYSCGDGSSCFFENDKFDTLHPYNSLASLDPSHFDVILLGLASNQPSPTRLLNEKAPIVLLSTYMIWPRPSKRFLARLRKEINTAV